MEDLSGGVLSLDHRYEVNAPRPYEGLALRYGSCQQPFSMDVDLWVMDLTGKLDIAPVAAAAVASRLEALARKASLMRSPHVLKVLDYGEVDESLPFILTESVGGACLRDIIKHQGRLPLSGSLKVIEEVALALEDAHRNGFGHLGVRADHVWFEQTPSGAYARLGGIGCSLLKHEIGLIGTEVDLSMAQVDHLAPESFDTVEVSEWRNSLTAPFRPGFDGDWSGHSTALAEVGASPDPLDPVAFDVFGLAVMAYECLTGSHPYIDQPGLSAAEQLRALGSADLIDPTSRGVELPLEVWRVLKGGLARDPGARPASALAFAQALSKAAIVEREEDTDEDPEDFDGPVELGMLSAPEELVGFEQEDSLADLMESTHARVLVAIVALLLITNVLTLVLLSQAGAADIEGKEGVVEMEASAEGAEVEVTEVVSNEEVE